MTLQIKLDRVMFAPSIDGRLSIKTPFDVILEKTPAGQIARIGSIGEFGIGESTGDALFDLGRTVAELYFSLAEHRDHLSSDLQSIFGILQEHIEQKCVRS